MNDFDKFDNELKAQMKRAWIVAAFTGLFWLGIGGVVVWAIIRFVLHYTS